MKRTRMERFAGKNAKKAAIVMAMAAVLASWLATLVAADPAPSRFEKWEPAIRKFERQDAENPAATDGVVFVGSSSIRRWNLEKWFGMEAPLNRGFGGSQIIDAVHFADQLVLKHKPRTIVFYSGDNDIAAGKSGKEVAEGFAEFCKLVHRELPKSKIAFISIKPSPSRWRLAEEMEAANARICRQCEADERLVFVDVWSPMIGHDGKPQPELFVKDMLHLNDAGYKLWTEKVKPLLAE